MKCDRLVSGLFLGVILLAAIMQRFDDYAAPASAHA
jgi:hypothetical protein